MTLAPEELIKHLKKDEIKNLHVINLIKENYYSDIEKYGNTIIVRNKDNKGTIYISSNNEMELRTFLENCNEFDKHFAAIESWMIPIIKERFEIKKLINAYQLILPSHISLIDPVTPPRLLTEKDAEIVDKHWEYKDEESLEYIKERIKNGISAGIDKYSKLVAWSLTHNDGSIGCIFVLEGHRKKGHAIDVLLNMAKTVQKTGNIPFLDIVEDNYRSINLAKKLGFVLDRKVCWFKLD